MSFHEASRSEASRSEASRSEASRSEASNIESLDPNFQIPTTSEENQDGIRWVDARQLTLEGMGWPQESVDFTRLPDRAESLVRPAVWELSRRSSGLRVRFKTNARAIRARWEVKLPDLALDHMPATGVSGLDLYCRDESRGGAWRWAAVGRPKAQQNELWLAESMSETEKEFCLYLPLYNQLGKLEIAVPVESTIQPVTPRSEKPICFYGTSIVHGACASRPGMSYPAILNRRLDWPFFNLGFSGNAKSEIEVAQLLAELDPSVYVLDPLPNMGAEETRERIGPFVQTLRSARPDTPIVLVEIITYNNAWINQKRIEKVTNVRAALRAVYEELVSQGVTGLYYVPGEPLLGEDNEGTVDGTHPTDSGFLRMADVLEPVIRPLLG